MRYLRMLALLVGLGAGSAHAIDMGFWSNMGPGDSNFGTPTASVGGVGNIMQAQGFTMGAGNEYDINHIYLALGASVNSPTVNISIYSNSAGSPGTSLATLNFNSVSSFGTPPQQVSFYGATPNFHLTAGTSYWVVVSELNGGAGGAGFDWYTSTDTGGNPSDQNGTGITYLGTKNFTSGSWSNSPGSLGIRIGGPGPVPVPEPGTMALSAVTVAVFAVAAHRRSKKAKA